MISLKSLIKELNFSSKEEFEKYQSKHNLRKSTKVNIGGDTRTVGDIEKQKNKNADNLAFFKHFSNKNSNSNKAKNFKKNDRIEFPNKDSFNDETITGKILKILDSGEYFVQTDRGWIETVKPKDVIGKAPEKDLQKPTKYSQDDLKDFVYAHMNDDNFPEEASRKKVSNYVYKQFSKDGKNYKMHNQIFSKDDIEKLIDNIVDDMQYGEGQH